MQLFGMTDCIPAVRTICMPLTRTYTVLCSHRLGLDFNHSVCVLPERDISTVSILIQ